MSIVATVAATAQRTGLFEAIAWGRFEVIAVDECLKYGMNESGEIFFTSSGQWMNLFPLPPGAVGHRETVKDLLPFATGRYGDTWRHKLSAEHIPRVLALAEQQRDFLRACLVALNKEIARVNADRPKRRTPMFEDMAEPARAG